MDEVIKFVDLFLSPTFRDRKELEEVMEEESNEVILCDAEGNLYEGT